MMEMRFNTIGEGDKHYDVYVAQIQKIHNDMYIIYVEFHSPKRFDVGTGWLMGKEGDFQMIYLVPDKDGYPILEIHLIPTNDEEKQFMDDAHIIVQFTGRYAFEGVIIPHLLISEDKGIIYQKKNFTI